MERPSTGWAGPYRHGHCGCPGSACHIIGTCPSSGHSPGCHPCRWRYQRFPFPNGIVSKGNSTLQKHHVRRQLQSIARDTDRRVEHCRLIQFAVWQLKPQRHAARALTGVRCAEIGTINGEAPNERHGLAGEKGRVAQITRLFRADEAAEHADALDMISAHTLMDAAEPLERIDDLPRIG